MIFSRRAALQREVDEWINKKNDLFQTNGCIIQKNIGGTIAALSILGYLKEKELEFHMEYQQDPDSLKGETNGKI